jgi:hypothetical protein
MQEAHPIQVSERCESSFCDLCIAHIYDSHLTVCATDSDVTLSSSNGVRFLVHRRNLETHSEVFSGGEPFATLDEVVEMSETAEILDLLLQFIYPQPPPDLVNIKVETLIGLAEAAVKYLFHTVIHICELQMRSVIEPTSMILTINALSGICSHSTPFRSYVMPRVMDVQSWIPPLKQL